MVAPMILATYMINQIYLPVPLDHIINYRYVASYVCCMWDIEQVTVIIVIATKFLQWV